MFGGLIETANAGDQNKTMKTLNDEETGETVALKPNARNRPLSKSELRKEDRQRTSERVDKSASLAIRYPRLKALKMNLLYFDRGIASWRHGILYRANLETAKSMLHFHCPSSLCKGGGFDLSKDLSSAVAGTKKSIVGARHCQGHRDEETGKTTLCKSVLHFKMTVVLKPKPMPRTALQLASAA
jgi:hypothetical protein